MEDPLVSCRRDSALSECRLSETRTSLLSKGHRESSGGYLLGFILDGGGIFDGFLLAASQEVGQVILTLPFMFSLTGLASGIIFQFLFATLALYTNFLLVSLHATYRRKIDVDSTHPHHRDPFHIVSYSELMYNLVGQRMGLLSQIVVYISLVGLSAVQIIATASNFYLLEERLSKRSWTFIWGCIFLFMLFIPNFRHYRVMSVFGVLTTTYVSWFMTFESIKEGQVDDVNYTTGGILNYFQGMVGILFTFGGHSSNIEVADVMDDPAAYDQCYFYSYLYVFTLTLPNAISTYYMFGKETRYNANAFSLYDTSIQRDVGIVMMVIHQMVAFGLFSGPLYHMWEKYWNVYNENYYKRILCRIPLAMFLLMLAAAMPFYGSVNTLLGAFGVSLSTYIIPLVAYNIVYQKSEEQESMVKKPPEWVHLPYMFAFNWVAAAGVFIGGVCIGGLGATIALVRDVQDFEFFANCYECDDDS
mmetsp:Transcript_21006/g.30321  ORF Transcript_21006/g.30321 Transcript_21006/m.30321 type:complete len:474 (-) Transcript_21006:48-1469(-)